MPVLFRGLAAALALLPAATAQTAGNSPEECKARLQYFQSLTAQAKTPDLTLADDPIFPAKGTSIGKGGNCGDSAAGINQPCSKFNNWGTFQTIATQKQLTLAVIPPEGIRYQDINQGQLGDCYFLAALASLAYAVPQLIEAMFVKRELWAKDVYTTKWSLNGAQVLVAVNNEIPYDKDRMDAWFATPTKENTNLVFWPVVAEKAWGKIFQTFKATEGGDWTHVIASLTAATVQTFYTDPKKSTPDQVWEFLQKGTTNKFPMGGGTCEGAKKYGMPAGHAYAIFRAYTLESGARAVEVYNPWGKDQYNGALPNPNKSDGIFSMLLEELLIAMDVVQMAEVFPGYRTSSVQVTSSSSQIIGVKEFEVKTDKPFFVSVNWPSNHLWQPCRVEDPEVMLAVSLKDYMNKPSLGTSKGRQFGVNSDYTMIKGPGQYVAYIMSRFQKDTYMDRVSLAIYASEDIEITDSARVPKDTIKAMVEPPCDDLTITKGELSEQGLYQRNEQSLFYGIPTYWSSDKDNVAFYKLKCEGWATIGANQWDEVKAGKDFSAECFKSADLGVCGAKDSPGVGGFAGMTCEDVKNKKYSNIACKGSKDSEYVKRFCPVTCIEMARKEQESVANPKAVCPPCSTITIQGQKSAFKNGLYFMSESITLNSIPTYWSLNKQWVAYYRDKATCKGWSVIGASQWYDVQQGANSPGPCLSATDLGTCGCFDTAAIPTYGATCADVAAKKWSNLNCRDAGVRNYCAAQCQACTASSRLFDADVQVTEPAAEQPDASLGGKAFALSGLGFVAAVPLFLAAIVAGAVFVRQRARRHMQYSAMDSLVTA